MLNTAVVTGGAKGIGAAISVALAKAGYNVIMGYKTSRERAEELAKVIISGYGVSCEAVYCDVTDPESARNIVDIAAKKYGSVDILVNNAGVAQQKLFTDITDDDWNRMIGVNLTGVFNTCRVASKYMVSQKSGSIVNISSMWGQVGASCEVHYSAAKAGVIGLTKALAKELAPSGVRVNCVCPGVVMTDMMKDFSEETLRELSEETPLGKLGTPKEIADAVAFLCSDRASFITGQILGVNGGFVI